MFIEIDDQYYPIGAIGFVDGSRGGEYIDEDTGEEKYRPPRAEVYLNITEAQAVGYNEVGGWHAVSVKKTLVGTRADRFLDALDSMYVLTNGGETQRLVYTA